jgi:predicted glycogen debranching enzyme
MRLLSQLQAGVNLITWEIEGPDGLSPWAGNRGIRDWLAADTSGNCERIRHVRKPGPMADDQISRIEKTAELKRQPFTWEADDIATRERRLSLEWLETDGLGGFACGTVAGARTRRYHGWYVPAIPPPRRRWMFVAGCDEFVSHGGDPIGISTQIYGDAVHPEGDANLVSFGLDPFPRWLYRTDDFSIERSLCLIRDRSITVVRYANRGKREVGLTVRPLLRFASVHELQHERNEFDTKTDVRGEVSWVKPIAYLPRLYLRGVGAKTEVESIWYRRFSYPVEAERGYDSEEDLWSPLVWTWTLAPGGEAYVLFSREEVAADPSHLIEAERRRRGVFTPTGDVVFDELARRAEAFLVDGDYRERSIIAGYPWFADWGRDSMIAAPGLAMATARYGAIARVLNGFAAMRRDGLIPNNFAGEEGEPEYNSIDAPLWFILAVEWFCSARRNPSRPAPLLAAVRSILSAFHQGTRYGIGVAPDGLLSGSAPGRALTWMDAVVDGTPVTPRSGKPVEVNALWHAALKSAARLERLAGENARARELESEAWHVSRRFNESFWCAEKEYLYDVLGEDGPDASIRPNQILAVSLTDDLLPPHRARAVYWTVRRRLLTPFGLRTLDEHDPSYRGQCAGGQRERDRAYHQGTVWPWLMGAFVDAHFRVLGSTEETRRMMRVWLAPLRAHVREAGLGFVSEIFDGDPPHRPRGCFAQAWSVAEIARLLYTHL